jgi:hypothetical protein
LPPVSLHAMLGGLATSATLLVGAAAVGASGTQRPKTIPSSDAPALKVDPIDALFVETSPHTSSAAKPAPTGRWWLAAALVATVASVTGWWTLAHDAETYQVADLWKMVLDTADGRRRLAHVLTGGAVVVLAILAALLASVARRNRLLALLVMFLVGGVVLMQAWLGTLMLLDGTGGPTVRFNTSESAPSE